MRRAGLGMTLLEVLIALAIFSLLGVACYRVLFSVIDVQRLGDEHSTRLSQWQKAVAVLDRDFSQWLAPSLLADSERDDDSLRLDDGDFLVRLRRGGYSNPLGLSRSTQLQVAYDIGPHPLHNRRGSRYYRDEQLYLRRHSWRQPDDRPKIQALLAAVERFELTVQTPSQRHRQWPPAAADKERPVALELVLEQPGLGAITRVYKVH